MANLRDIVVKILRDYPFKDELSNARVTKMVYLADWHQALNYNRQISDIVWNFDNYGPFVWDIKKMIQENQKDFVIQDTHNMFGGRKTLLQLKDGASGPQLTVEEEKSLDHVIEVTKGLNWEKFIKLVYSTHPVASSPRYTKLDLLGKSQEYRSE